MAHLYLVDDLSAVAVGSEVLLEGAEATHAVTVSRARVGELLSIGDGAGRVVSGSVVHVERGQLRLRIEAVVDHPRRSPAMVLVQALAKGGRDESAVQAATELGVDVVVPWAAARSVARWDAQKQVKGRARWQSIVREAAKQSLRPHIPTVGELASTADVAAMASRERVLVLEPTAGDAITEVEFTDQDLVLVVGPEGGVDPGELERLVAAGARPVRLGAEVLRTSTAGPAAIAALSVLLGRW